MIFIRRRRIEIITACSVLLLALAAWSLWPDYVTTLTDPGEFHHATLTVDAAGRSRILTLAPGERVRVLTVRHIIDGRWNSTMAEVRTAAGIVGWIDIHALNETDGIRLL